MTELQNKVCELYREILLCFMDRQFVMQTEISDIDPTREDKHLKNSVMYLGVGVLKYINRPEVTEKPEVLEEFFKWCKAFLSVASSEIKKRWNFNDIILKTISMLHPQQALSCAA